MRKGKRNHIGIYICNCGEKSKDQVDTEKVMEVSSQLKNVVVVRTFVQFCRDKEIVQIGADVKENDLNGIIMASCKGEGEWFINQAGLTSRLIGIVDMWEIYKVLNDKEATTQKVISEIQNLASHDNHLLSS